MSRAYDATHLSSSAGHQVQMTNWYEIVIGEVSNDITLMVQSCTLPEVSTPVVELPYGNSKAKVAGQVEYADGNIVIMDAIKIDIERQLIEWQNQVYDPKTGKMGWVDQYKRDVIVTQYGPDGTFERKWQFIGAWPSSINYGELSGESSDKKNITITLSYDKAYRI